jgi:DNA invertase Pin-like site-specific DNA recombinase
MRVAIYCRVSTGEQTIENQERELREIAHRRSWDVVEVFKDEGISGTKGRDKRPGLDALCNAAGRREFDMIMAWSVDRLGRSLQDLVAFLGDIHAQGVDLFLHRQNIDTSTPSGKAMFQMMGVFAEFERAMIRDRVNAGIARARAQGKVFGRPRLDARLEAKIKAELVDGKAGMLKIAAKHGVGSGTVQRIKAELTSDQL